MIYKWDEWSEQKTSLEQNQTSSYQAHDYESIVECSMDSHILRDGK